jgi:hypothetical protein
MLCVAERGRHGVCIRSRRVVRRMGGMEAGSLRRVKVKRCDGDAPRRNKPRPLFRASTWFSVAHDGLPSPKTPKALELSPESLQGYPYPVHGSFPFQS